MAPSMSRRTRCVDSLSINWNSYASVCSRRLYESIETMITRAIAEEWDRADPLAAFRGRFAIDDDGLYMDGNSLGRPPLATEARVAKVLAAWRRDLIIAWREWIRVPRRIGDQVATSVLEARPGEVIVGDSTSVNLYKAAAAAIAARPDRKTLVT